MEWGLPVIISIPEGVTLRPGELVNVSWLAAPTPIAQPPAISANVTAMGR